jgi:hypothetical protein
MDLAKSITKYFLQNLITNSTEDLQIRLISKIPIIMDALLAYGSGSEESDNGEQQQKQASSREEGDIGEITGFFTYKK